MNTPSLTVAIATHNRRSDLEKTCAVLCALLPQPDEVIVTADACTDGTEDFIRENYPQFLLLVNERALGSIGSRDRMIRGARGDIILSLDDDSHPIEMDFVARVCALFAQNPRLAVAAFPQRSDEFPKSLTTDNFGAPHITGTFSSSGAAIRRAVFLELGGYPVQFHHAYEEPDFSLRCTAAGYEVRCETSLHVRHHYSAAQRNEMRTHHFHARNELWSVMMRCPAPWLVGVGAFRLLRQLGYACARGPRWVAREPAWWLDFLAGLPQCLTQRKPVPWKLYRRWLMLLHEPIFPKNEPAKKSAPQNSP
jgi:GT2 family glycosyltransferase